MTPIGFYLKFTLDPAFSGQVKVNFATSLAQMEAARNAANGIDQADASPFNIWVDGTLMVYNREENGNRWGSFGLFSVGADCLVNDKGWSICRCISIA